LHDAGQVQTPHEVLALLTFNQELLNSKYLRTCFVEHLRTGLNLRQLTDVMRRSSKPKFELKISIPRLMSNK
jgi:hypothetical protein